MMTDDEPRSRDKGGVAQKRGRSGDRAARALRRCQSGNLTIITALTFTILVGFAGLAVDAPSWYSDKRQMQTAADAAAMAGAYELSRPDSGVADVIAAATHAAARNGFGDSVTVTLEGGGMAVRAVVSEPAQSFLSQVVMETPPTLTASAVARRKRASICILALDPEAPAAVEVVGNAHIASPGCRIYVNSTDSGALSLQGAATSGQSC